MKRPISTAAIGVASIAWAAGSDSAWVEVAHMILGIYFLIAVWNHEGKEPERAKPVNVIIDGRAGEGQA